MVLFCSRKPQVFQDFYLGMQCSGCGMRFPPELSMYYSQHLDWHFRQNRKGKKNIRKAASRRWYYTLMDWKKYEEHEDLEERGKALCIIGRNLKLNSWIENKFLRVLG